MHRPLPSPDTRPDWLISPWRTAIVHSLAVLTFTGLIAALSYGSTPGSGLHLLGTLWFVNLIGVGLILDGSSWRSALAQFPAAAASVLALNALAEHLAGPAPERPLTASALLVACIVWGIVFAIGHAVVHAHRILGPTGLGAGVDRRARAHAPEGANDAPTVADDSQAHAHPPPHDRGAA